MFFEQAFRKIATAMSQWTGRPVAFVLALACVFLWAASGPVLGFSDLWQLTINTATTIITFLMVFLIQNAQNCNTKAIQIKLDELIRATRGAENSVIDLETLSEDQIALVAKRYCSLAARARKTVGMFENGSDVIDLVVASKKFKAKGQARTRKKPSRRTGKRA